MQSGFQYLEFGVKSKIFRGKTTFLLLLSLTLYSSDYELEI